MTRSEAVSQGDAVTLRDVARVADVHPSTVSRALDPTKSDLVGPATRERVLAAAERLGYRPHLIASGLRRGRTLTVGAIVPDLSNTIYAPVVRGVAHAIGKHHYMLMVADTEDDSDRFAAIAAHFQERRMDALVTTAARHGDEGVLERCVADGMPVVLAVRTLPGSGLPAVLYDDEGGAAEAARHLASLGHRVVSQVRGPDDIEPFRARDRGFVRAARESGMDVRDVRSTAAQPTISEGRRVAERLLADHKDCTAIFAQNDLLALGVLEAIGAAGLSCPDDVSVVGYNDAFFTSHTAPALTTVRIPTYEVGLLAGELAIGCIQRPLEPPRQLWVDPQLVVRDSTAPPPGRTPR